jgi:phosphate transport system substrate-binding protein
VLSPGRLKERGLVQFPSAFGAMHVVANLPDVQQYQLKLAPDVLADLFLGKIAKWNDSRIAEHNAGLPLPDLAVVPIYRTDASGTNFVSTAYLSRVSEAWAAGPRAGTAVRWPKGLGKTAAGINGVASAIKSTPGAIGFSNAITVKAQGLVGVQLRNKAGRFVRPDVAGIAAAVERAEWMSHNNADAMDTDGAEAWPIVAPTFVLVPADLPADRVAAGLGTLKVFDWAYRNGGDIAREMGFVPVPDAAQANVRAAAWSAVRGPDGQPVWKG